MILKYLSTAYNLQKYIFRPLRSYKKLDSGKIRALKDCVGCIICLEI